MAYTYTLNDGTEFTIADGGLNTTATNLTLFGPNRTGYGQELNQNLLKLLQNFADEFQPPGTNIQGQLWFNKSTQQLNVCTNNGFSPVSSVSLAGTFPIRQKDGDIFFNTNTNQLYISAGGNFNLVGPTYTRTQGPSGAIPVAISDGVVTHDIIQLQFGNTIIATFSADSVFSPTTPIPGFPIINTGITLNNSLPGPTFNSNVVGALTGNVVGNLTGNTIGTHTGPVIGNITGNVNGNVVATTLSGSLTGDVTSTNGRINNLVSSNATVTSGNVTGLTNLSAANATVTNINIGTAYSTNLSVANLVVSGGTIAGLSALSVTNLSTTNFITANAQITSGNATGLTNISSTNGTFTNFSAGNIYVLGGSLSGIGGFTALSTQTTNLATGNALITGGSLTNIATVTALSGQITNLSTPNISVTGGNISNTVGANNTLTSANLINATATTKSYNDNSNAVATTAYVNSVLPRGAIIMWGGSIASIPAGWQLCDGSNSSPDLRGQFIVGAGNSQYPVAGTGGSASVTLTNSNLPSHTHSANLSGTTDQGGAHNHTVIDPGHVHPTLQGGYMTSGGYFGYGTQGGGVTGSATTGITLAQASTHNHTMTLTGNVSSTGNGQSFSILPPYYALCYIQKMY
jgi:hypothetical protein